MDALRLLVLLCAAVSCFAQKCPPSTVLIMCDMSENAKQAATEVSRYDLLQTAVRKFLTNPAIANPENNIRIAIYGYNSNGAFNIVPEWRSPAETLLLVTSINTTNEGGSWTYVGLSNITSSPPTSVNILKLISSQGSTVASRTNMAVAEATRVRNLNWTISVTAVKGQNVINITELTAINNGQTPPILAGYRDLAADLDKIPGMLGCTAPTADQLCSQCRSDAGSYYVADPEYCDSFLDCTTSPPTKRPCAAGGFYENGNSCNHVNSVNCPVGECTTSTPANTFYPSFMCCNKYFECTGGANVPRQCPNGQMFNSAKKACENIPDPQAGCGQVGRHVCDVKPAEPVEPRTCTVNCDMDPTGDPCFYICDNEKRPLPGGTAWSKSACTLIHSSACRPNNDTTTRDLSTDCTATFLATFNEGRRDVFNQRTGAYINVYSTVQEAILANNSAIFASTMTDPYIYYFYLNNVDYGINVAFRLRFNLQNPTIGTVYDLLSNNYCAECPETISFTATATSATDRTISIMFHTTTEIAFIKADISISNMNGWLELTVVFGDTTVYGVLKELAQDGTTVVKTSQFSVFTKPPGSTIKTNRCGIQLGRGRNKGLVGSINQFAIFRFCQNISSVTN